LTATVTTFGSVGLAGFLRGVVDRLDDWRRDIGRGAMSSW
jgi:hypothetical protein